MLNGSTSYILPCKAWGCSSSTSGKPNYNMGLIYRQENPLAGISLLEIFDWEKEGRLFYYPVTVDGIRYILKMGDGGEWTAEGLSRDICAHISTIMEEHEL